MVTSASVVPCIPGCLVMSPSKLVIRVPYSGGFLATMAPPDGFSSRLLLIYDVCTLAAPILHLLRTASFGMLTPLSVQLSKMQPEPNLENGAFLLSLKLQFTKMQPSPKLMKLVMVAFSKMVPLGKLPPGP